MEGADKDMDSRVSLAPFSRQVIMIDGAQCREREEELSLSPPSPLSVCLPNEDVLLHVASVFYIHRAPKGKDGAVTLEVLLLSLRLLREGGRGEAGAQT